MRVITFSRYFPKAHPKGGMPTYFVEKMWGSLLDQGLISLSKAVELSRQSGIGGWNMDSIRHANFGVKHHTIRAGNRWKVGDEYSPRVWSGKPYRSKQIEFAPPIKVEKVWEFGINKSDYFIRNQDGIIRSIGFNELTTIALNDGLERDDFEAWFAIHPKKGQEAFTGQILCHNPEINY
jgi:hypothetical protein